MNIKLFILSFSIVSTGLYAQPLRFSDKSGDIEIDRAVLMKSRINDLISLGKIPRILNSPNDLKPLGKPLKIDRKVVENIGESVDYIYEGFTLHYSAMSQPEMTLLGIRFYEGAALEFEDDRQLGIGHGLGPLFAESDQARAKKLTSGSFSIFISESIERIWVTLTESKVSEMVIFMEGS